MTNNPIIAALHTTLYYVLILRISNPYIYRSIIGEEKEEKCVKLNARRIKQVKPNLFNSNVAIR